MPSRFAMTENERITTSSKYVRDVLICRPHAIVRWSNVALVAFAFAFAFAFAVVGSSVLVGGFGEERRAVAVPFTLVISAGSVAWAVGMIRSEVRADAGGLTIRDRWRMRQFAWDEVAGFGAVEQQPPLRAVAAATHAPA